MVAPPRIRVRFGCHKKGHKMPPIIALDGREAQFADRPAGDKVPMRNDDGWVRGRCEFNREGSEERCDFIRGDGRSDRPARADRSFVVDKANGDQRVKDSGGGGSISSGGRGRLP